MLDSPGYWIRSPDKRNEKIIPRFIGYACSWDVTLASNGWLGWFIIRRTTVLQHWFDFHSIPIWWITARGGYKSGVLSVLGGTEQRLQRL